MFQQIFSVARNTFTESIRQPIYVVLLGVTIFVMMLGLALAGYTLDDDNKIMIDACLFAMFFFGLGLAAFTSTGVLSREIENKTVLTVISKPISRPAFIIGKYVGVMSAVSVALWVWSIVFLMLVRHRVMSTASDRLDMPVILFSLGALIIAAIVSVWGNYFYGWVFTSRFSSILAIGLTIGYGLVLVINKNWHFQSITTEFAREEGSLIQLLWALLLVFEGLAVICAVAITCSTRLGQVMTLVICFGMLVMGFLSDAFFSRMAQTRGWGKVLYAAPFNVQYVWISDALTQNHPVTAEYVGNVSLYSALYVIAVLSLAVALFQTRETG